VEDTTAEILGGLDQLAEWASDTGATLLGTGNVPPNGIVVSTTSEVSSDMVAHYADNVGSVGSVLGAVSAGVVGHYDHGIDRNVRTTKVCDTTQAGKRSTRTVESNIQTAKDLMIPNHSTSNDAEERTALVCGLSEFLAATNKPICFTTDGGVVLSVLVVAVVQAGGLAGIKVCTRTDAGIPVSVGTQVLVQSGGVAGDFVCFRVEEAGSRVTPFDKVLYLAPEESFKPLLFRLGGVLPEGTYTYPSRELVEVGYPIIQTGGLRGDTCHTSIDAPDTAIRVCNIEEDAKNPDIGESAWIDPPTTPIDPEPPTGSTTVIPTKEMYTVATTITTQLEDGTDVQMSDVSLQMTSSAFAWTFSGTLLDSTQKTLLAPNSDGTPKLLVVTVNGVTWKVLVEQMPTRRVFAQTVIKVTGRGVTALLGSPYRERSSAFIDTAVTNQQLAELVLPSDWVLDWQMPTWLVPAGAYSYQDKTPIEALHDIVKGCGGMVIPSLTDKSIKVLPRYPVLPWNYAATAADLEIPDSAIVELTEEPVAREIINGVYVHGMDVGGKLGFIRRTGTAGDKLTKTEVHPVITDDAALRAVGERVLAREYPAPKVKTLTTLMETNEVDLVSLGTFIKARIHPDTEGRADGTKQTVEVVPAIVQGVLVKADLVSGVWQTLTLGDRGTNARIAFEDLLPRDPLVVGTVLHSVGGVTTVTLYDGGSLKVRGSASVGSKVYIRGGIIQGAAPDLPLSTIVIG
jgi:hypothetical protein